MVTITEEEDNYDTDTGYKTTANYIMAMTHINNIVTQEYIDQTYTNDYHHHFVDEIVAEVKYNVRPQESWLVCCYHFLIYHHYLVDEVVQLGQGRKQFTRGTVGC